MRRAIKISAPENLNAYIQNAEKACVNYLKEIDRDDLAEIRANFPKFKKSRKNTAVFGLYQTESTMQATAAKYFLNTFAKTHRAA